MTDLDRFIGVVEGADLLGIHPVTARKWIRSGRWETEFPGVNVRTVAGKQVMSLRRVQEFIERTAA